VHYRNPGNSRKAFLRSQVFLIGYQPAPRENPPRSPPVHSDFLQNIITAKNELEKAVSTKTPLIPADFEKDQKVAPKPSGTPPPLPVIDEVPYVPENTDQGILESKNKQKFIRNLTSIAIAGRNRFLTQIKDF